MSSVYATQEDKVMNHLQRTGRRAVRWAWGLTLLIAALFTIGYFFPFEFTDVTTAMLAVAGTAVALYVYAWVHAIAVVEREIIDTALAATDNAVSAVPGFVAILAVVVRWLLGVPPTSFEWIVFALVAVIVLKDVIINQRASNRLQLLASELIRSR